MPTYIQHKACTPRTVNCINVISASGGYKSICQYLVAYLL